MLLPLHLNLAGGGPPGGGDNDFETPFRDANYRRRFGGLWALLLVMFAGCSADMVGLDDDRCVLYVTPGKAAQVTRWQLDHCEALRVVVTP